MANKTKKTLFFFFTEILQNLSFMIYFATKTFTKICDCDVTGISFFAFFMQCCVIVTNPIGCIETSKADEIN